MVCMEIVELMHMQQVELAAICTGGDSASGTDDLNPDAVSSSGGGGGGGAAGGGGVFFFSKLSVFNCSINMKRQLELQEEGVLRPPGDA